MDSRRKAPGSEVYANQAAGIEQERTTEAVVLTYRHPFRPGEQDNPPRWLARLRLTWHCFWASIFVAFFQKDLVYEPVYLWGRVMAVSEQALTSTLFALFLLAVRRRFRR